MLRLIRNLNPQCVSLRPVLHRRPVFGVAGPFSFWYFPEQSMTFAVTAGAGVIETDFINDRFWKTTSTMRRLSPQLSRIAVLEVRMLQDQDSQHELSCCRRCCHCCCRSSTLSLCSRSQQHASADVRSRPRLQLAHSGHPEVRALRRTIQHAQGLLGP